MSPSRPAAAATHDAPPPTRASRRKLATRNRLLAAAFELMADKDPDGLTIQQITDAADVGFGSFYNHFESKDALRAAVIERYYAAHADHLDDLLAAVEDPAEVVAISVRHTVLRAEREPTWGRFLAREGFSTAAITDGLGRRLLRDIRRGIAAGRFSTVDVLMSFVACGGAVLAAISSDLLANDRQAPSDGPAAATPAPPERVAAAVLRTLGLSAAEAARIASRPLPAWDQPAG